MSVDIVNYLESKGCQIEHVNGSEIKTHCFFCEEDPEKRGRLYVNLSPEPVLGLFFCFLCGTSGGFNKIRKHFGDPIIKEDNSPLEDAVIAIYTDAAKYYHENLTDEAREYLHKERGFTDATIDKHQFGWADGTLITHLIAQGHHIEDIKTTGLVKANGSDFLQDQITIPYHMNGFVTQIRGKFMDGKYTTPPGQKAQIFNTDSIWDEPEVLCTEGEFDCVLLEQMGFAAIGIPGVKSIKDERINSYLEAAKRIFIVFDNDGPGKDAAAKLATALGPRSRVVELPPEHPGADISDLVVKYGKSKDDFEFYCQKAKGGLLVSVKEAFEEWLEVEGNPNLVGLRLNLELIDAEMNYGLIPGQVAILLAKTNSMKTLTTINLFHRMSLIKPDLKILFISLEQTRNEWFERARRIHKFYDLDADNQKTIEYWQDRLMIVDKNRVTIDELVDTIEQYEYEIGRPDMVAIDYLGYFSRSFKGEAYERTSAAVMKLKEIAKEKKIVIWTPSQANRTHGHGEELSMGSSRDAGTVEETADFMMSVWLPDLKTGVQKQDQTGDLYLKVLKSRDGGVGKEIVLKFSPISLALVPYGDKLYKRVLDERRYAQAGDSHGMAIYRHKTGDMKIYPDGQVPVI